MNFRYPNIAVFAPLGSGKTTAAKHLASDHGYVRMAFATGVREALVEMLNPFFKQEGFPTIGIEDIDKDKAVYRTMLQWVGTDLVREHLGQKDFWVDRLVRKVNYWTEHEVGPFVVDDMRFPNEARALKDAGWVFLFIEADENLRFDNYLASTTYLPNEVAAKWEAANSHPSESHYDAIKEIAGNSLITVRNTHDFEAFLTDVDTAVLSAYYLENK